MNNLNLYGNRNPFKLLQSIFDDIVINFSVMLDTSQYVASRKTSKMVPTYDSSIGGMIKEYTRIQSLTISDLPENHPLAIVFDNLLISRVDYKQKWQATFDNEIQEMFFVIDERDPNEEYKLTNPVYTVRIRHTQDRMTRNKPLNYEIDILSGDYLEDKHPSVSPMCMNDSFIDIISKANDRIHNLNIIFNKCKDAVRYPNDLMDCVDYRYLKAFFDENKVGSTARRFFYDGLMTYTTRSKFVADIIKDSKKMNELLAKHPVDASGVPDSKAFAEEIVRYLHLNDIMLGHWDTMIRDAIRDKYSNGSVGLDYSIIDRIDKA